MAKRLNKTERQVIAKKVSEKIKANYKEEVRKMKDSYKPSKKYKQIEKELDTIGNSIMAIKKLTENDEYYSRSLYVRLDYCNIDDYNKSKKEYLENVKERELNIPQLPYISYSDLEDDLVLMGISEDLSTEDLINSLVEKYQKSQVTD